jgi:hypothetical protein
LLVDRLARWIGDFLKSLTSQGMEITPNKKRRIIKCQNFKHDE